MFYRLLFAACILPVAVHAQWAGTLNLPVVQQAPGAMVGHGMCKASINGEIIEKACTETLFFQNSIIDHQTISMDDGSKSYTFTDGRLLRDGVSMSFAFEDQGRVLQEVTDCNKTLINKDKEIVVDYKIMWSKTTRPDKYEECSPDPLQDKLDAIQR